MIDLLFSWLIYIDNLLWSYVGAFLIVILGIYFSVKSRFVQIRRFPAILKHFSRLLRRDQGDVLGIHPLKAFFADIGGCIGIGNIVAVCTAIQVGGPGAAFWVWVAGFFGMILKYSEIYLGILHRIPNSRGGYDGGPMYFLKKAIGFRWVPIAVAILLGIYGIEVYMFGVMTESISSNWNINRYVVIAVLLVFTIIAAAGGIKRVGAISSLIIPVFLFLYFGMSFWIFFQNITAFPAMLGLIFKSAFTGHAMVGGFVGSTMILAVSTGIARGCYSGDIGIGFASVIHSETKTIRPEKQASLAIVGIFLDTFVICTSSMFLILLTGVWHQPMDASLLVQFALGQYFPYMNFFMPFFLFLLGYSTMIAYFCVGLKAAKFLSPKRGELLYSLYAVVILLACSFLNPSKALVIMSFSGVLLLILNLWGMFRLRKEIHFNI